MKQEMTVDTYWLDQLRKKWGKLAQMAEKVAESAQNEAEKQHHKGMAKAYRKAAQELKAQAETYAMPTPPTKPEPVCSCCLPVGSDCPVEEIVPPGQDIMLESCIEAGCPFLRIKGYRRLRPEDNGNSCH